MFLFFYGKSVGKYTIPMDGMGNKPGPQKETSTVFQASMLQV